MFLTTKGRYAIMAIIDMCEDIELNKPVSVKLIAENQNLSLYYLERIFALLKKAEIVKSIRGPGGGYVFAKSPEAIKLSEILKAVGENIEITKCGLEGTQSCNSKCNTKCNSHLLWENLTAYILKYLESTTVQDAYQLKFFFKE